MNSSHPEKQCLVDYSSGILNDLQAQEVARHLGECTECEATIRSLEAKSDTFVAGLREPPKEQPLLKERPYLKTVDAAIKLAGAPEGKTLPSAVENKAAPAAEKKLGPYVILAKLGEGGMGAVFKAKHEHLGKVVAVKVLPKKAMQDPAAVARFRREMLAVGQLHHPNIVIAFDAGEAQGIHYLTMEYVAGSDLSTIVKKNGPVTIEQAISYTAQAAKGLAFAHSKNIVHRDIKPANLLVDVEGTVKILDMGLARLDDGGAANAEANQGLTQTGQVMGTVDYMAPEQAFDTHRADAKADVYSLGCTLFRILTGQNSYGGETVVQKILAHREQPIPSLAKLCPQTPAALDALYQRMMAKRPEDRPTMAEVVKELEAIANPQAVAASAPAIVIDVQKSPIVKKPEPAKKPVRREAQPSGSNRRAKPPVKLIAGGIGGFALIMSGVIWFIIRDKDGNELARVAAPEGSSVQVVAGSAAVKVAPPPVVAPTATTPPIAISPFNAAQARAHQQAWAAYLGMSVESKNSIDMRLTLLPPGEFLMGSTPEQVAAAMKMGEEDKMPLKDEYYKSMPGEMPQHKVRIRRPLLIGTTEVTVAQFRKFAESRKYVTEAEKYGFGDCSGDERIFAAASEGKQKAMKGLSWRSPGIFSLTDDNPATQITWNDAAAFCNWLSEQEGRQPWYRPDGKGGWFVAAYADGYRLPTEAEWEYACRAGTTTHYSFGDDKSQLGRYGWFISESGNKTQPVALKLPNPFGLFDMHGNAMEWCHDGFDWTWYEKCPSDDPVANLQNASRVVRGGYSIHKAADARSAYRNNVTADQRYYLLGFRIVRSLELTAPAPAPGGAAPLTDVNSPGFQQWLKATQALPAEQQLEAVSKKLMELNPGFDGKLTESYYGKNTPPKIENGVVVDLGLVTDYVENLAPLRALSGLRSLRCSGSIPRQGRLVDLSPLAGLPLTSLSCGETQVADLSPLKGMPLKALACNSTQVADLAPLVGMPLTDVRIFHTAVTDLTPLKGMKIGILYFYNTPVSDLSPLAGMPLTSLSCSETQIADLTPLKGVPLTSFWFHDTHVSDLTPLAGMPLKSLRFTPAKITRGIDVVRAMTTLETLGLSHAGSGSGVYTPAEFWKKYDAGEFAQSKSTQKLAYLDPAFQQWVEATQKLPAEQQLEAASKKLMELNPGFDGKLTGLRFKQNPQPLVTKDVVTEVGFVSDKVTDISPVRAFPGLTGLRCAGEEAMSGSLTDLSPLSGLPLKTLFVTGNKNLSDLAPLRGMQLISFESNYTAVADFTVLEGMPLAYLHTGNAVVADLSFVRGMPLEIFYTNGTFSDLSPLRGAKLRHLSMGQRSQVTDLSPLKGMPLAILNADNSPLSDLSPLVECKQLKTLTVTKTQVTPAGVAALQKALPDCKITWDDPAKALAYLDPAFEQWVATTQKLPAEQQLEAVSKKLMELNPGFDGKLSAWRKPDAPPKIDKGVVKSIEIISDNVTDVSPVRGFSGLTGLRCIGGPTSKGKLTDLAPLTGLPLVWLEVDGNAALSDLSPLNGMKLTQFSASFTAITQESLLVLQGMSLTYLHAGQAEVSDLSFLKGMPLEIVYINGSFSDLSPLRGMPLRHLSCFNSQVTDLSPLKGMPLLNLNMDRSPLSDLSPLVECKDLKTLAVTKTKVTAEQVAALQKALPDCKIVWDDPAKAPAKP